MNKIFSVDIIIPAHNEEEVIIETLESIDRHVKIPYMITVVNDCSSDNTKKEVLKYMRSHRRIRLLNTTSNKRGFSNAIHTGFVKTKGKYVVPVMADLCDDPKTINRMYKEIQEGWDIVCGSRYIKGGGKVGGPRVQGFLSQMVCLTLHLFSGIPTKDVSNAFKMYKRSTLSQVTFNQQSGVEMSMELTIQAYFQGARIKDIPTTWRGRTQGTSKFKIVKRTPRYWRIYRWTIENRLRQLGHLSLKPFYART